jgi:hypothetical protein
MDWQAITNFFMIVITVFVFVAGAFQWVSMVMLKGIEKKVSSICEENQRDHDEMKRDNEAVHKDIWDRIHHHKHSERGNVEIPF